MKEERAMRDKDLYQNLLGIVSPWTVDSVTMDVEKQRVDVTVSHPPRILFSCLECGTGSSVFDHAEEWVWRHLDSCQFFNPHSLMFVEKFSLYDLMPKRNHSFLNSFGKRYFPRLQFFLYFLLVESSF